jgi:LL-diaminopimelate aminotransferase
MKSDRLLSLPPYLFEELENHYREAVSAGRDVIDLSIGDPDLSPPRTLIAGLRRALEIPSHHRYPPQRGSAVLKESIRRYLGRRCGIDPSDEEILILIGSKEGIGHLPLAVCNPGDTVVVPDPGYPVYGAASVFAGCGVRSLKLRESNGFLPDFAGLSVEGDERARLVFLNYPNNPTGASAAASVFAEALEFGEANGGAVIANDAAYAEVYFGQEPPSLLSGHPQVLERPVIELFSFSKTFCITGWRVGFAVGRRDIIDALAHLKANIDSGVFGAIQEAVAETLDTEGDEYTARMRSEFGSRRASAMQYAGKLGFECLDTCATFYVWAKVPKPFDSMAYALHVLERADVLVTPGHGFGGGGEGYFRIALTQPVDKIEEAFDRIGGI